MVAPRPLWATMTPIPAMANANAASWKGFNRSPVRSIDRPMVKKTCICTTSDARPGEINPFMAMNKRPNWPSPMARP